MQQVIAELQRLQRRSRWMLLVQRLAVFLAWVVGVVLAIVLIDYALRLPSAARFILLAAGLIVGGYIKWTYLRPAWIFQPSLTQLALRIERVLPNVAGRLASSVEFAAAGVDQGNELAARTVADTQTRLSGSSVNTVIDSRRTLRDVGIMLLVLAISLAGVIASPTAASIGLQRVFLPFSDAKWPARTGVASLMEATVHPQGQALALRAGVTRGAASQSLYAHYRIHNATGPQPWQHIVLTQQAEGHVHERLIDTSAGEAIEFYFTSDDDETAMQHLQLVPPPAVQRASLTVTPPAYAQPHIPEYRAELGQGLDNRAITDTPSLIGSQASLRIELNKSLPGPTSVAEALGWSESDANELRFTVQENDTVWQLNWTLTRTQSFNLHLVDEHGLSNADPISFRIEAVEDHLPNVTITQPESDETVLPTAVIALRAEARDDVALATLAIEAHVQTEGRSPEETLAANSNWQHAAEVSQAAGNADASLDLATLSPKQGDTVLITGVAHDVYEEGASSSRAVRSAPRRLRIVSETDFATQLRRQLGAVRQNAIRIEAQQAELQEDVVETGVPEGSGFDRAQAQISERIAAQRQSVQDVGRLLQQNRLDDPQLQQMLNQANDLLDAAGRAANKAVQEMEAQRGGKASGKSSQPQDQKQNEKPDQRLDQSNQAGAPQANQGDQRGQAQPSTQPQTPSQNQPNAGDQPSAESQDGSESPDQDAEPSTPQSQEHREITDAQQEVRDELADLIKLLDRDEDTWVVRRQLDSLLREQAELEAATAQLGEQTIGRNPEDLTEQQRTDLDRIAQRQRELRDEARKMIENMRQRAKALEQVDPESAQSMRSAADTAEQRQLDQDMENAAQRAQQNQMTSATQAQQSAQSTMQQMRNDIENTRRAQAQQLIRKLASLVESIERLINVQENELIALNGAKEAQNFGGLDRSMIRLNQNTQAVAGEARAAGQEARRIGRTLDRAADAQGAAIAALRAIPISFDEALNGENRSLELLKEAKAQAEKLQEQTQEEETRRKREELMTAYREFAERQVALREETLPLVQEAELDRRQLVEARRLSSSQDEIRTGLNQLRDTTSEILDSPIFLHVHRSIDTWAATVSEALNAGTANVDVTDRQQQIADSIGRLIKALEESMSPPDEFDQNQQQDQQQGGGEGQQQQPLLPPITQLKLLQGVQEQVYSLTKELDTRSDLDAAQKRTRLRDIGQQQRELQELGQQILEMLQQQQQQQQQQQHDAPEPQPEPTEPEEGNP